MQNDIIANILIVNSLQSITILNIYTWYDIPEPYDTIGSRAYLQQTPTCTRANHRGILYPSSPGGDPVAAVSSA